MITVAVPLPATPGPAVTLSVPLVTVSVVVSVRAVHVRDRDAGDWQHRVLVDALCARHRVHRRVVHRD